MSRTDYYKTYGINNDKKKRSEYEKEVLYNLMQPPRMDPRKTAPTITSWQPWFEQQADLLELPEDQGNKYALVVVDVHTGITDAEPLENKESATVRDAFKTIYERDIIKEMPKIIKTDAGTEFKGAVKKYFKDNKVLQRQALTNRHRQVALVERRNLTIGRALFQRMLAQELLSGETDKQWVDDLPQVVEYINKYNKRKQSDEDADKLPKFDKHNKKLIPIGTKVRHVLDYPINLADGERWAGNFRATDIRWNQHPKTITNILIMPNQPPLYILDDNNKVAYTRNQIQLVNDSEQWPIPDEVVRGDISKYVPEKILGNKIIKRKKHYLVKWRGYDETTWEPANTLKQDVPDMVNKYEKSLKP